MTEYADPEKFFAVEFTLSAVRKEDYAALHSALEQIRFEFARGGSCISIESVHTDAVVNR